MRSVNIPIPFGNVKQWAKGRRTFRPGPIFPGIVNNSRWAYFLTDKFLPRYCDMINDPSLHKYGCHTLDRAANFPGTSMDPVSLPHRGIRPYKRRSALWWKCARIAFDYLFARFWEFKNDPVYLRPDANSGIPKMTKDVREGLQRAEYLYTNADDIFTLIEHGRWSDVTDQYGIWPVARILDRAQGDSATIEVQNGRVSIEPKKVRKSFDGSVEIEADKHLDPEYFRGLLAKRIRTVVGVSRDHNLMPLKVANMMLKSCFKQAKSLHQGDPQATAAVMSKLAPPAEYDVYTGDCHEFDHSCEQDEVATFFEWIHSRLGVREGCAQLCLSTINPAYIARAIYADGHDGPHFEGDLNDWLWMFHYKYYAVGSGSAFTTVFARWKKSTDDFACACEAGYMDPTTQFYARMVSLEQTPIGYYVQSGDDFKWYLKISIANEASVKLNQAQAKVNPSLVWEWDPPGEEAYLSNAWSKEVTRTERGKSLIWRGIPNLGNAWCNTFSPERYTHAYLATDQPSVSESFLASYYGLVGAADPAMVKAIKKFPCYGWSIKNERMSGLNPKWDSFIDSFWGLLYDAGYKHVQPLFEQVAAFEKRMLDAMEVEAVSAADEEFLVNQDIIYYRRDPTEISDGVLRKFFASVDGDANAALTQAMAA